MQWSDIEIQITLILCTTHNTTILPSKLIKILIRKKQKMMFLNNIKARASVFNMTNTSLLYHNFFFLNSNSLPTLNFFIHSSIALSVSFFHNLILFIFNFFLNYLLSLNTLFWLLNICLLFLQFKLILLYIFIYQIQRAEF